MPSRKLTKLEAWVDARLDKNITIVERQILINYKQALDSIRVELTKIYTKYANTKGVLTYAEMSKYNRLKALHDQLTGMMGPALSKNIRLVNKLAKINYEEAFYGRAWAIDQASGVSLRWGLLNENTVRQAILQSKWRAFEEIAFKRLKGDFTVQVDRVLTQGLIQGYSYPKMASAIKDMVEKRSVADSLRIVRTEGHRAAVQGALDNYDDARNIGVDFEQIWDATLDMKTRPEHGALDGKPAVDRGGVLMWHATAPDGQDIWTEGPGMSGNASMDINCRCRVRGQIKDYAPKVRRIRDEGIQDYTTFKKWAKDHGLEKNIYGQEY